jgi:hypothetical protein
MTAEFKTREQIAEKYRQEKYHLLTNNCLIKSVRFARECKRLGIDVRVVFCLGSAPARLPGSGKPFKVPVLHAWGEVDGERIELSHPLGYEGILGMMPGKVKALVKLRF